MPVLSDDWNGPWVQVDGDAEVLHMPEAVDGLLDYFPLHLRRASRLGGVSGGHAHSGQVADPSHADRLGSDRDWWIPSRHGRATRRPTDTLSKLASGETVRRRRLGTSARAAGDRCRGVCLSWVIVLWLHGLNRPRARWSIRSEAIAIGRATVVLGLIMGTVLFAFRLPDVSRLFLLLLFPSQWLLTLSTRVALRKAFERLRARGYNLRYVLVVGVGPRGQAFARKLEEHKELGLRIAGFVDDDSFDRPQPWRQLGPVASIEELLHTSVIDEVALCLPFEWDRMNAIAHLCEEEGKIVRVPRRHARSGVRARSIRRARRNTCLLTCQRSGSSGGAPGQAGLRPGRHEPGARGRLTADYRDRTLDPPAGRRAGPLPADSRRLHGRQFQMLKLRTMSLDAEARLEELMASSEINGAAFKMSQDPRVTRSGRFLRRTSLDELPQLGNVLRGDMSLVGPRPALPREVQTYDLWHRRRLSMKPGITVCGRSQPAARPTSTRGRSSTSYIDRWSLWLDLKILARTLPAAIDAAWLAHDEGQIVPPPWDAAGRHNSDEPSQPPQHAAATDVVVDQEGLSKHKAASAAEGLKPWARDDRVVVRWIGSMARSAGGFHFPHRSVVPDMKPMRRHSRGQPVKRAAVGDLHDEETAWPQPAVEVA